MANYRVTAPYVLLKVKDRASGKEQISGFYDGAVVSDNVVDEEFLLRHLDRGWVEEVDESAPEPEPADPPDPTPPVDPDAVPTGTADEVLAWVGDNSARAGRALVVEKTTEKPRTTLLDKLTKLAEQQA